MIDDAEIEELKAGKRAAFKRLYDGYAGRVYGCALRMLGNEADAADVTQEVFLTVSRRIGDFERRSALSTWMYRITVNAALDRRKKMKATVSLDQMLSEYGESGLDIRAAAEDPSSRMEEESLQRDVRRAIATLKPRLAAAMTLRYGDGLGYDEIAEVLGCSIGTVKSRIARAHERLMPLLEKIYRRHLLEPGGER